MTDASGKMVLKMSRQRKKQQHRWSNEQTVRLLEAMLNKLKDNPEKFEKPTASQFYASLFKEYNLQDLEELGVILVKNKMRNLKSSFIKAEEWKGQTGAGILEEEKSSVKEYITKICPHYEMLEQIFGQRRNVNMPFVYDTENSANRQMLFSDDSCVEFEMDVSVPKTGDTSAENANDAFIQIEETSNLENNAEVPVEQTPNKSSVDRFKLSMKKPQYGDKKRTANSSLQYLTMLQEKRNEIEEERLTIEKKKLKIEEKKSKKQIEVEEKKLELERDKFKAEYELKKMDMEKQYELKKYELELKYTNH